MMDEFRVILKARQFIRDSKIQSAPVDIERLAAAANASIKVRNDLDDDEAGQTIPLGTKNIIVINGNHRKERQRFTALHEIAHIILDLPSQHHGNGISTSKLISYRARPEEEILCDVFAAECLLPYDLFKADVEEADISFDAVKELADRYEASVTSTGSRFAVCCDEPCAFVLMEDDRIRYVSSSKFLRELKGWIGIGTGIPRGSVAARLLNESSRAQDYYEIPTDTWFADGIKGFNVIAEEAIVLKEWGQCLSLISFVQEATTKNQGRNDDSNDDGEPLLEDLDGVLPWPSKKRRR